MVQTKPTIIELDMDKLEDILRRLDAKELDADDYEAIKTVIGAYVCLVHTVGEKDTTIRRLRQMLFGAKTEKTSAVLGNLKNTESASESHPSSAASAEAAHDPADQNANSPLPDIAAEADGSAVADASAGADAKASDGASTDHADMVSDDTDAPGQTPQGPRGHGCNGADAYTGAEKVDVRHESLQPGDSCPQCEKGTLYNMRRAGVLVRLVGQAPVGAKVYYLQKLRCGLCGTVFTADPPAGVDAEEKRDATVGSMIALLKYGNGMPFHRNEMLQQSIGVPMPASTQWDIVADRAERLDPVFEELARQAAQGDVVYNDDTTVKILAMMGEQALAKPPTNEIAEDSSEDLMEIMGAAAKKAGDSRKGMFTTGIVSETREGQKIVLFLSGRQHAGENLADVLARRAADLAAPIQMCDALARNLPGELKTILANCLAHGRRKFVDVVDRFPEECRHVLESLSVVYGNDTIAKERKLSPAERLLFHQVQSGPAMEELHAWLGRQFDERRVEPNSALGKAVAYMLRHWEKLTLFLRVAGAPLG
jgi:transposase